MDLKCFNCISDEWKRISSSGDKTATYSTAADAAKDAVTTMSGTALCAFHAITMKAAAAGRLAGF